MDEECHYLNWPTQPNYWFKFKGANVMGFKIVPFIFIIVGIALLCTMQQVEGLHSLFLGLGTFYLILGLIFLLCNIWVIKILSWRVYWHIHCMTKEESKQEQKLFNEKQALKKKERITKKHQKRYQKNQCEQLDGPEVQQGTLTL